MAKEKDFKITAGQLIFPVSLTAFVVFIMLAFQTSQLLRERDALMDARTQQAKPFEDAQKVQAQVNAIAVGTKKLADEGNKSAKIIVDNLKKAGITINDQPQGAAAAPEAKDEKAAEPAAAPAAPTKKPAQEPAE